MNKGSICFMTTYGAPPNLTNLKSLRLFFLSDICVPCELVCERGNFKTFLWPVPKD